LLKHFFLYVLEDFQTSQSLCALKFTRAEPAFVKETVERVLGVYPLIPETEPAPEMPATRAFSRQAAASSSLPT
jgi:hypothetical protein